MKSRLSRRKFLASASASMVPAALAYAQPYKGSLLALLKDQQQSAKVSGTNWKDAGVVDLSNSPYAKLKTVPIRAVVIQNGFWSQRRRDIEARRIPRRRL